MVEVAQNSWSCVLKKPFLCSSISNLTASDVCLSKEMWLVFLFSQFLIVWGFKINPKDHAVVTLVTGERFFISSFHFILTFSIRSGYSAGAIALGQSLVDVGSQLTRVVLVTPEVEDSNRQLMSKLWTVIEIQPIACNHKLDPSITSDQFDLQGEQYLAGSNLPLLLVVDIVLFRNSKVASHMQQIRGLDFDSIQACCLYG